jgi:para-aminobenzoate synthetase/4-amino-4-deoxychorismate lyase
LETLRLHQGRYWLLNGHLARLKRSAAALGFPFDTIAILKSLLSAALHHKEGQWRVRLCLSQHGNVNIETLPLEQHPQPLNIVMAKTAITRSNPWLRHKTTRRDMYPALPHAREEIFDVLLFNELGEVTEFTRGNLVIEREGLLITPALSCGVLPGIFREKLLHRKRIKESIIHIDDLAQAKMIWFINSVRGAIAVNPNTTR